jgi:hypothetical protein
MPQTAWIAIVGIVVALAIIALCLLVFTM